MLKYSRIAYFFVLLSDKNCIPVSVLLEKNLFYLKDLKSQMFYNAKTASKNVAIYSVLLGGVQQNCSTLIF